MYYLYNVAHMISSRTLDSPPSEHHQTPSHFRGSEALYSRVMQTVIDILDTWYENGVPLAKKRATTKQYLQEFFDV